MLVCCEYVLFLRLVFHSEMPLSALAGPVSSLRMLDLKMMELVTVHADIQGQQDFTYSTKNCTKHILQSKLCVSLSLVCAHDMFPETRANVHTVQNGKADAKRYMSSN